MSLVVIKKKKCYLAQLMVSFYQHLVLAACGCKPPVKGPVESFVLNTIHPSHFLKTRILKSVMVAGYPGLFLAFPSTLLAIPAVPFDLKLLLT